MITPLRAGGHGDDLQYGFAVPTAVLAGQEEHELRRELEAMFATAEPTDRASLESACARARATIDAHPLARNAVGDLLHCYDVVLGDRLELDVALLAFTDVTYPPSHPFEVRVSQRDHLRAALRACWTAALSVETLADRAARGLNVLDARPWIFMRAVDGAAEGGARNWLMDADHVASG